MDIFQPNQFFTDFPRLRADFGNFEITSNHTVNRTPFYNCVGWAAEFDNTKPWWPDPDGYFYWPNGAPRELTIGAFITAFRSHQFNRCQTSWFEPGYDKVCLFANEHGPAHAARLLRPGLWTSKMGPNVDISHVLEDVEGAVFGKPVVFMKRKNGSRMSRNPLKRIAVWIADRGADG